jgi:hypothetical protein
LPSNKQPSQPTRAQQWQKGYEMLQLCEICARKGCHIRLPSSSLDTQASCGMHQERRQKNW